MTTAIVIGISSFCAIAGVFLIVSGIRLIKSGHKCSRGSYNQIIGFRSKDSERR